MPEESVLAAMEQMDNIKVEKLVHDFLTAQSLKILPQEPFGDAVTQFVDKQDKLAMETFVDENLAVQVKQLLLANEDSDEELESNMDRIRTQQEELFKAGVLKRKSKNKKLRPRPQTWDSDEDGPWENQPGAVELSGAEEDEENVAPAGRRKKASSLLSDDDDVSVVSGTTKKTATKKAPAKKAPPKPRAPAKSKAPTKVPAARGRKKAVTEPSDDEDNDSDVIMMDEAPAAPAKSQPKRAAAAKGRQTQTQTQLSFSQQPKTSTARELSDDEISDDDDAFEPMSKKR
jgi:double-strand break repair protein MRE11